MIESHLSVDERRGDATTVLVVAGELDLLSSPILAEAIERALSAGGKQVVLDLAGVEFIDMSGLRLLLECSSSNGNGSPRVALANLSATVRRVLALAW